MIVDGRAVEASAVMQVAHLMALAARTAPKGRGADHIETVVVSGEDLQQLGEDVISHGEETGQPLYVRRQLSAEMSSSFDYRGQKCPDGA